MYKIGDIVRITNFNSDKLKFLTVYVNEEMEKMLGGEFEIERIRIHSMHGYLLTIDGWDFPPEWVEPMNPLTMLKLSESEIKILMDLNKE